MFALTILFSSSKSCGSLTGDLLKRFPQGADSYTGPYEGTIRTASQNVLRQLINGDKLVIVGPKDDFESLVKSFLVYILQNSRLEDLLKNAVR